jgi:hypothetical protein
VCVCVCERERERERESECVLVCLFACLLVCLCACVFVCVCVTTEMGSRTGTILGPCILGPCIASNFGGVAKSRYLQVSAFGRATLKLDFLRCGSRRIRLVRGTGHRCSHEPDHPRF